MVARNLVVAGIAWLAVQAWAADAPWPTFAELAVKGVVYHDVRVLSASATALTVKHRGGLVQIPLRDLSPELQERFGFDPQAAKAAERKQAEETEARLAREKQAADEELQRSRMVPKAAHGSPAEKALQQFGKPAKWGRVDLRPKYREWELYTKDQGYRPSCSIFAVVNALEFQNAVAIGRPEKLSEEYLIWATRRTLGMAADAQGEHASPEVEDAGFSLSEVVGALRTYGIPLQAEMPNMRGLPMNRIEAPAEEVVRRARARREVFTYPIPGRDNDTRIENIVHALNEEVPVVIGMRWPMLRTLKGALISTQPPIEGYSHAVTLVGYYNDSGVPDETRFIFRNSWGANWGAGGCGFVELRYLRQHLVDGLILDVRMGSAPSGSGHGRSGP